MLKALVLFAAFLASCCDAIKFPIVMVPGIAGSQIEAKHYKKMEDYPFYCARLAEWTQLWLSLEEVAPPFANCLAKDMSMEFNNKTFKYQEPDGVGVRIPNFGSTKSIEYLDSDRDVVVEYVTKYFHDIVQYFVDNAGYERDLSVVAAPYDWRLSPWSMDGYFENLTALVERVTAKYNAPAIVISHSMGGPVLQSFFNTTTAAWKDKHIAAWFPVEGVWAGAPKVLKAIISGDNFGTPAPTTELIDMERSLESTLFLMPMPGLWPKNHSGLIYLPGKTYGIGDYQQLMEDLDMKFPKERLDIVMEKRASLQAPGVRIFCIYGTGVDTAWGYQYGALDRTGPTKYIYGDGDGTVPLPSLEYCREWSSKQTQPIALKSFPGVEHVKAIMNPSIFAYIHFQMETLETEYTNAGSTFH